VLYNHEKLTNHRTDGGLEKMDTIKELTVWELLQLRNILSLPTETYNLIYHTERDKQDTKVLVEKLSKLLNARFGI